MIIRIPTDSTLDAFEQTTQLDGREYLMRFMWMARESCWWLNLYDQDETPLALGVRLVVSWSLLRRFVDPRLPPGMLIVVDLSRTDQEIADQSELGERCVLMYADAAELAAIGAA